MATVAARVSILSEGEEISQSTISQKYKNAELIGKKKLGG